MAFTHGQQSVVVELPYKLDTPPPVVLVTGVVWRTTVHHRSVLVGMCVLLCILDLFLLCLFRFLPQTCVVCLPVSVGCFVVVVRFSLFTINGICGTTNANNGVFTLGR